MIHINDICTFVVGQINRACFSYMVSIKGEIISD